MVQRATVLCLVAALVIGLGPAASAEETDSPDKPWNKFGLSLGGTFNANNATVRLGLKGVGATVDVEEALGLDVGTATFRADGFWRFTQSRRHRLDLSWYAIRKSGEKTLTQDLTIGDTVFKTGTEVNSTFNIDVFKAGYSYSFFQDDRFDLALSAGLFVLPVEFGINATGAIQLVEEESITAPLPVLGLRGDFALTEKWFLRSSFELFYLEIGDFRGGITDIRLGVEYKPFEHVGFGLTAESFNLNVEAEGSDYPGVDLLGRFEFENLGLMAYIKLFY